MFNALKYTQALEEAGFSREQADTSMKVLIDVMNENFATKPDLKELEVVLKSEMKELETGLRSEMKEIETGLRSDIRDIKSDMKSLDTKIETSFQRLDYRLTIKLGTLMIAAIGVVATLIKVLSLKA